MLFKSKLGAICFLIASSRFLLLFSTRKKQAKNIPARVLKKGNLGQVEKQDSAEKSIEVLLASRAADSRGSTKPLKRVEKWVCRTFPVSRIARLGSARLCLLGTGPALSPKRKRHTQREREQNPRNNHASPILPPITMSTEEETKATATTEEPTPTANKKAKMALPQSPEEEWPESWMMTEGEIKDQRHLNRQEPNVPVSVAQLKELGICYWKLDADAYTYPVKAVPWDPTDAVDPKLSQLRDDRGYSYADILTIHPDTLPGYEEKLKMFFEEHIHDAEEIRYILGGSGYFDVRDKQDKWIRVHVKKGDLMTLPEGACWNVLDVSLTLCVCVLECLWERE